MTIYDELFDRKKRGESYNGVLERVLGVESETEGER